MNARLQARLLAEHIDHATPYRPNETPLSERPTRIDAICEYAGILTAAIAWACVVALIGILALDPPEWPNEPPAPVAQPATASTSPGDFAAGDVGRESQPSTKRSTP